MVNMKYLPGVGSDFQFKDPGSAIFRDRLYAYLLCINDASWHLAQDVLKKNFDYPKLGLGRCLRCELFRESSMYSYLFMGVL